jgi:hypothetical protein
MKRANELQLVSETLKGHKVTKEQLIELQNEFGSKWSEYDVYLDLLDEHFISQLSRPENKHHPVSYVELRSLLDKFTSEHMELVSKLDHNSYGVIKEKQISTNLVFFVDENGNHSHKKDIRMITVLRKKDFSTHDPIYEVILE